MATMDNAYQDATQSGVDLVVGLGASGYSCARFLARQGRDLRVVDSRYEPPFAGQLRDTLPEVDVEFGEFDDLPLDDVDRVITSPGIPSSVPLLKRAFKLGLPVISDIELFALAAPSQILGITGSNGKSTVTSWIAHLLEEAGMSCLSGGNLGVPALDLLDGEIPDYYVLELSSFQLERTHNLHLKAGAILNIGTDHVDHHGSVENYRRAKWQMLRHCQTAILHAPLIGSSEFAKSVDKRMTEVVLYGAEPDNGITYHLAHSEIEGEQQDGTLTQSWLCRNGERLLPTSVLKVFGHHNHLNALAVLALADCCGLEFKNVVHGMTSFAGLDHRMQWVGESRGVTWINDSKGTNSDATIAALKSVTSDVVLIAGGQGKGDNFLSLAQVLADARHVVGVVLIGEDAAAIEGALRTCNFNRLMVNAASMDEAVTKAETLANGNGTVLLSPACASFDMFEGYQARGDAFVQAWRELA
ncbi:MAG: UDP-N-acetylmuramoyl-L-alanine--D-glutamate ligase [Gammaproteobacteria bacterium]